MLNIDIVADIVCPWCFIGKRRLETAIELVRQELPNFEYSTCWRPFFLNPDTPPERALPAFPRTEVWRACCGRRAFERVREAGRAYGIDYAFEKISLRANTFQAHRLLYWAQQHGSADALIERLFVAQFQRGEHVGDGAVLVNIAAECGYPAAEVAAYLTSTADAGLVLADARAIREMACAWCRPSSWKTNTSLWAQKIRRCWANAILQLAGAGK